MEKAQRLLLHYIRLAAKGEDIDKDPDYRAEIESIVELIMDEVEERIQIRIEQALADCGIRRPV
jgi:hypothetical protein